VDQKPRSARKKLHLARNLWIPRAGESDPLTGKCDRASKIPDPQRRIRIPRFGGRDCCQYFDGRAADNAIGWSKDPIRNAGIAIRRACTRFTKL